MNDSLYHPGDSFHVPDQPIEILFAPIQASLMKIGETVEFDRAIRPERTFAIHDGYLSDRGLAGIKDLLARSPEKDFGYRWLAPFETA